LEPESEQINDRLQPVQPIDLLSFVVRTTVITDADLIDAPPFGARDLCAYFNFDTEVVGRQLKFRQNLSAKHLIADFYIRQHLVIQQVK
jgi:hypothetical protein